MLSPDHYRSFGELDDAAAIEVLTVLRDRVRGAPRRGHAAAVAIINHRREPGASLAHPHAQVLATRLRPPAIAAAVARAERRADRPRARRPAPQRDPDARQHHGRRRPAPWCPFASSSPFLMRVAHGAGRRARSTRARRRESPPSRSRPRDALARLGRRARRPGRTTWWSTARRAARPPSTGTSRSRPASRRARRVRAGDRHLREHRRARARGRARSATVAP